MSEKKVPADGTWRMATWPGAANEEEAAAEWTAVIAPPPDFEGYCAWCEEKKATVIACGVYREEVEAYPRCEDCCPEIAEEEGS